MNADYRELERREPDRVKVLELNRFVSPDGVFTNHLAGVDDLRGDGVHFTPAGADLVASWLAPQLRGVAAGNLVPPIS
jgi:lysophospholipase L1-like esterase